MYNQTRLETKERKLRNRQHQVRIELLMPMGNCLLLMQDSQLVMYGAVMINSIQIEDQACESSRDPQWVLLGICTRMMETMAQHS